jgi:hypothetical protein
MKHTSDDSVFGEKCKTRGGEQFEVDNTEHITLLLFDQIFIDLFVPHMTLKKNTFF